MNVRAVIIAMLAVAFSSAAKADRIDPCLLLTDAEKVEWGVAPGTAPAHLLQPGGVVACKWDAAPGGVTIILSQGVPDRVVQLRAMQAKAREENTPEQLQARGEYFEGGVMCKVVIAGGQETSQCVGATEQSAIAMTVSRPAAGDTVAYPAAQLKIAATLVSRLAAKGG